jgi:ABC-type dipeptide/oligopeptide/nickel transport system permease component
VIVCQAAAIILVSGLAGATLIRVAPGFSVDEQMLDPRLSAQSLGLQRERLEYRNPLLFYGRFLAGVWRGDAGTSVIYGQPVGRLIAERAPTTLRADNASLRSRGTRLRMEHGFAAGDCMRSA